MEDDSLPQYVGIALGISSQPWDELGLGDDPAVAASDDLDVTVERITALLLIRIVAWIQPRGTYPDLSTTTICRHLLVNPDAWPRQSVDQTVMDQLKHYVKTILAGYNDVPYHSFKHCYHVTISTNKLIDMVLQDSTPETARPPMTYGFRDDPLMQLALLYSALIHDVDHHGIPNRQLANEDDALAIKYNDQSIAENESLYIGFSELLKSEKYDKLRHTIFPQREDYRRFRQATINLVLSTDIASPERSQLGKSKWKEAFGDPYETVERKVLKQLERRASASGGTKAAPATAAVATHGGSSKGGPLGTAKASRRLSTQSIMSDLSLDDNVTRERDLDDDSSVSLSPDVSDNEGEDKNGKLASVEGPLKSPAVGTGSLKMRKLKGKTSGAAFAESGSGVLKSPSLDLTAGSTHSESASNMSGMALKFHRRLSTSGGPSSFSKRYRSTRLGLLRTVDLSGEAIEAYGSAVASRTSATGADTVNPQETKLGPPETVDELRESVLMETILKAADVAHNLQGFGQMAKWSNRLFLELRRAYVQGRGDSPQNGWFSNQIGFLEAYLLPLARKLDDTGVFGDEVGAQFAENVQRNRDQWTKEGMHLTAQIIMEGEKEYPFDDESTD